MNEQRSSLRFRFAESVYLNHGIRENHKTSTTPQQAFFAFEDKLSISNDQHLILTARLQI